MARIARCSNKRAPRRSYSEARAGAWSKPATGRRLKRRWTPPTRCAHGPSSDWTPRAASRPANRSARKKSADLQRGRVRDELRRQPAMRADLAQAQGFETLAIESSRAIVE